MFLEIKCSDICVKIYLWLSIFVLRNSEQKNLIEIIFFWPYCKMVNIHFNNGEIELLKPWLSIHIHSVDIRIKSILIKII
jgi:hypothetical protein